MTTPTDDLLFTARLKHIVRRSIEALPPLDRYERLENCRRAGDGYVSVHADNGLVRIDWGGRPLALVPASAFAEDAYLDDLSMSSVPDVPDDASELSEG